jgi:hypothetical protein
MLKERSSMIDFEVVEETVTYEVTCKTGKVPTPQISYSGLARLLTANPHWLCRTEAGPGGTLIAHVTRLEVAVHERLLVPVPALV